MYYGTNIHRLQSTSLYWSVVLLKGCRVCLLAKLGKQLGRMERNLPWNWQWRRKSFPSFLCQGWIFKSWTYLWLSGQQNPFSWFQSQSLKSEDGFLWYHMSGDCKSLEIIHFAPNGPDEYIHQYCPKSTHSWPLGALMLHTHNILTPLLLFCKPWWQLGMGKDGKATHNKIKLSSLVISFAVDRPFEPKFTLSCKSELHLSISPSSLIPTFIG